MQDLYRYIDTWDGTRLFIYIVIMILVIWFFSKRDIGINILVGILVGGFIVSYFNQRSINNNDSDAENLQIKKDALMPDVKPTVMQHDDIINFLFSIQDMRVYNPLQYDAMVKNINTFYELYDVSIMDPKASYINYELMKQYKRDALNALMSIIYQLSDDKKTRDQINNAATILDTVLTQELDHISYIVDNYTYINGYNVDTKIINYGPKPYNEYNDMFKPYSYEIY
jgi:hypothetical protein